LIQNSKFKIQNSSRGFTLIELLVVMAIIGILAATAIVNFGKNDDRDVRAEKDRLTSFVREVQNKALAGDKTGISESGKVCGFGIHQQGNSAVQIYYIITSNLNADCSSVANTYASSGKYDLGSPFSLANEVEISSSFSDVFFLSPNGQVYYNGSTSAGNFPISISLTKDSVSLSPAISIDQSGRIY